MARSKLPIPPEIIAAYQRGDPIQPLCDKLNMSRETFHRRARVEGWTRPNRHAESALITSIEDVARITRKLQMSDAMIRSREASPDQYLRIIEVMKTRLVEIIRSGAQKPADIRILTESLKVMAQVEDGITGFATGTRIMIEREYGEDSQDEGGDGIVTVRLVEELAEPPPRQTATARDRSED